MDNQIEKPPSVNQVKYYDSKFEYALTYQRPDGQIVTITLIRRDISGPPELIIAVNPRQDNSDATPIQQIIFPFEEACLVTSFMGSSGMNIALKN